uniref:Uncharacterized protein n=1 Tax=Globodera rostochiensis TaxID=31243 RepID=A0A914H5A0_GLORO
MNKLIMMTILIRMKTRVALIKKKREFIARIDEIKRCQPGEQIKLIKDLGISEGAFNSWKKEFGLPINSNIIYSDSEKMELMEKYYKIKQRNPKLNVTDIAKKLNVSRATLYNWKKHTSEHSMPLSDDNLWAWNLAKKKRT